MGFLTNININSIVFRKIMVCLVLLMFILPTHLIYASIACPYPIEIEQNDGTKLTIELYGDEHFHWVESTDG